ncbi:MAG: hypothetical protein ACPGYP_06045 [Solirubrobacterales bacterium]
MLEPLDAFAQLAKRFALARSEPVVTFSTVQMVRLRPEVRSLSRDAEARCHVADSAIGSGERHGITTEILRE